MYGVRLGESWLFLKTLLFVLGFCLFDLILYIPVNNLSVTSEWVFLG